MKKLLFTNTFAFIIDLFMSVVASASAILFIRYFFSAVPGFSRYFLLWGLLSLLASTIAISISKTYRILFRFASFKSVLNIFLCAVIKSVLMVLVCLILKDLVLYKLLPLILCDGAVTILILISHHSLVFLYQAGSEYAEERAVNSLNVVIFGSSPKSISLVTRYSRSENFNVLGFISRNQIMDGKLIMDYPVKYLPAGSNSIPFSNVEAVIFAKHDEWLLESEKLVAECVSQGICVLTVPSTANENFPGLQTVEIKHLLESKFIPDRMTGVERAVKRLADLCLSVVLIVIFSPVMAAISLVILFSDGKPVLFRQERIGRFGRPFDILKFRTMRVDAEADGPALYGGDDDPRLTKVGRFLRIHHLDEMPQLFNVFKGQMSFVGYRPERKYYIDRIVEKDPRYAYLYQIRPGVTSYATLRNGYTDTLDKMLRRLDFDLYYLSHRSVFLDLRVLWDTFANIVFGKVF